MSNAVEHDFSKLDSSELEQAYVASVQAAETTDHVGRKNRLARQRAEIVEELKARGQAREILQRLVSHSDDEVRRWARGNLDRLDKRSSRSSPPEQRSKGPFWPQIEWQCSHSPPPALTRDEIAERLRRSVPGFCDSLMDLVLPAIGLWPQRCSQITATVSRFGGEPLAPPGWQWPVAQEEPLLFVGQINCADLRDLPGSELLPSAGLLAFFGDHDGVTGCNSFAAVGVYHWADADRLVPAVAAIEPLEIFPSCALALRPLLDLPHPFSRAVEKLGLGEEQDKAYRDAWWEIRDHGIPLDCVGYAGFSKLLGWPDLVQNDLWRFESEDDARLLLQVDSYCNGEELHGWGPGGSLYYLLAEQDLLARRYKRCEFEGQFT
jgi:uncharacterized protein YwqG